MPPESYGYESRQEAVSGLAYLESKLHLPINEFAKEYLKQENIIFGGFRWIFKIIMIVSLMATFIAFLFIFATADPLAGFLSFILSGAEYGIIFYLAYLSNNFIGIRSLRIKNQAENNRKDLERIETMAKDLQKRIAERAHQISTGDNAIVVIDSKTGDIQQTITVRQDLRDALAKLIAAAE